MNIFKVHTSSADETMGWGTILVRLLGGGDIICLFGDLGTGKTTLIKGVAQGCGLPVSKVTSPTFVLLNIYRVKLPIYHFDFYRLDHNAEIPLIGYEEFVYGEGITFIEWADRMKNLLPEERLNIHFFHKGKDRRSLRFEAKGQRYAGIVEGLKLAQLKKKNSGIRRSGSGKKLIPSSSFAPRTLNA